MTNDDRVCHAGECDAEISIDRGKVKKVYDLYDVEAEYFDGMIVFRDMICEAYFIEPSKTASSMHQLAMHGLLQHIKQTSDRDASIWHRLMLCAKDIKILTKSICDKTSSSIYLQYQLETCYIIIRGLL